MSHHRSQNCIGDEHILKTQIDATPSLKPRRLEDNLEATVEGTASVPLFLPPERLPFGKQGGASPALPLCTPAGNSSIIQITIEAKLLAQITALRQDMVRLQKDNKVLSSKVDEMQQLLNQ
ncbi:hypothetical protein L3X38_000359 [Prunus dulcis]|uniref:Uncharacterized protein n=1 Tax=Prunus dulcis TaxID=3755 RepID=A0AAD4UQC1_PRUDU|nr:hypothetical protein L3X38_000359 [Prunus dulcis]